MNAISAIHGPPEPEIKRMENNKENKTVWVNHLLCFFLLILGVSFPLRLIILPRNIDVRDENYVRHDGGHDTADCGACCSKVLIDMKIIIKWGVNEILTSKVHRNKVHPDRNDDHGEGKSEKFHDNISEGDVLVRVREGVVCA